jgi:UTP-glucose-1-phosphate uridylyltransferase
MIAVVLCAGFATRMYPLTKEFPKPLLDVAGRPVIDFLCRKEPVYAFRLNASRLDIGGIETYRAADHYLRNNPLKAS